MNTPMKARILSLLHFAHQQEQLMIDGLSEAERQAQGTSERWAAKDFVANILLWKRLQTQKLALAQRGEQPPVWRDMTLVHQINSEAFLDYQSRSFEEIYEAANHVFDGLLTQVEHLGEEELSDPHHYTWQEGEPLWEETLGNGLWHPCSQLTSFYLQSGKRQQAVQLQEVLLAAVRQAALPADALAVTLYNQVCFYATHGWPEKALLLLPEALQLKPTLIEWSKHDSDLDALRTEAAFQAIFTDSHLHAPTPTYSLISPQALYTSSTQETPPLILDVRSAAEYSAGHIRGAITIPLGKLATELDRLPQNRPIVTYCNMHHRGASRGEQAAAQLQEHGYQAQALDGGYPAWKDQGLPIEEAL